jgi:hypothetical protein
LQTVPQTTLQMLDFLSGVNGSPFSIALSLLMYGT